MLASTASAGLCECGCGSQTRIAPVTSKAKGWLKGQPLRFVLGHRSRLPSQRVHPNKGRYGTQSFSWKGGRHVDVHGYVKVFVLRDDPFREMANAAGYVSEHRLVMARHLGRPLARSEVVDHMNQERTDNRIENLRLFASHREHRLSHMQYVCRDCGSANIGRAV